MRSQKPLVEVLHCCFEYCEVKAAIQNFCNWSYRMSIGLNSFHLFFCRKVKDSRKKIPGSLLLIKAFHMSGNITK